MCLNGISMPGAENHMCSILTWHHLTWPRRWRPTRREMSPRSQASPERLKLLPCRFSIVFGSNSNVLEPREKDKATFLQGSAAVSCFSLRDDVRGMTSEAAGQHFGPDFPSWPHPRLMQPQLPGRGRRRREVKRRSFRLTCSGRGAI